MLHVVHLLVCELLPLAVLDPHASIGLVRNGETALRRSLLQHFLFPLLQRKNRLLTIIRGVCTYLCKVRVVFVGLESKSEGIEALATAGEPLILQVVIALSMVVQLDAHVSYEQLSLYLLFLFAPPPFTPIWTVLLWRGVAPFLDTQLPFEPLNAQS